MVKVYLMEDFSNDLVYFMNDKISHSIHLFDNIQLKFKVERIKDSLENFFYSITFNFNEPITVEQIRAFRIFLRKIEKKMINFKLSVL